MRKTGTRVLLGTIENATYNGPQNKIHLFDGSFRTGYRIVGFKVTPNIPGTSQEITAKLSTEPKSTVTAWDWSDIQEVAWAFWASDQATLSSNYSNIRDGNIIVEDLWVSAAGADGIINYEIELEKYSFPSADGALAQIRNLSQS